MKGSFRALAVLAIIVEFLGVSAHGFVSKPPLLRASVRATRSVQPTLHALRMQHCYAVGNQRCTIADQPQCPRLSAADPSVPTSSPAPTSAPSSTAAGNNLLLSTLPLVLGALTAHPLPAAALDVAASPSPIASALVAYGHYLGLLLVAGSLTSERLLIKPDMSVEDEKLLGLADIVYGLAGVLVLGTGYLRVTQYGKGWEFYSHEPVFWVKLALFAVMGAASLFPTIKIIQRAVGIKKAEEGKGEAVPPLSAKLAKRMITLVNGEVCVAFFFLLLLFLSSRLSLLIIFFSSPSPYSWHS